MRTTPLFYIEPQHSWYDQLSFDADHVQSEFYGKEVIVADREFVEQDSDECIDFAREHDVAFLVVGDPLAATTHTDIMSRCRQKNVSDKDQSKSHIPG